MKILKSSFTIRARNTPRGGQGSALTSAVNIFALGDGSPDPARMRTANAKGTRWGRPAVVRFGDVGRPAPSQVLPRIVKKHLIR